MNYNSSCSSLLERLRSHAIWQEQKRIATTAFLETNVNPALQCQKSENNELCDSSELFISNKEVDFLKSLHHNSTTNEIDTKIVSNLYENLICSEDIPSSNCSQKSSSATDESNVNEPASKFSYLRKGQGLKRFNSKKFKGFHIIATNKIKEQPVKELKHRSVLLSKKNSDNFEESDKKKTYLGLTQNKSNLANNSPMVFHRNFDAFEVLEELVEHDSFISTSSRVNYLFQEDCSTPVPLRKSSFEHMDLTPITQPNEKSLTMVIGKQVTGHNVTPVRSLFSGQSHQSCGFNRNIRSQSDYSSVTAKLSEQSSTSIECDTKFTAGNNQSGILKKFLDIPSSSSKSSSSVPKVHFPNNGARILEYNQDPEESITETICSEDTDLVNISDLENLKFLGLNYNFEIIHEVSSNENKNLAVNQVFQKTSMNLRKSQVYESPKFSHIEFPNDCQRQTKVPKIKALSPSSKSVENLDTLHSDSNKRSIHNNINAEKTSMDTNVETEQVKQFKHDNNNDIEVNKLLLLSKVYDLKKEIKMFKYKNETMDKLIQELEDEKKTLIHSQEKERHQKMNINKYGLDNIKKKNYNVPLCKNDLDQKITKLNERICNLKTENNLLKRKVVILNKKERELIKKPNISTIDDNKKKVLRKNDVSLSAGKENNTNLSLVSDKKALNHQLKVDTMDSLAIKVDENGHEENVKENAIPEILAFDSDKVNKPTYFNAVTPNISIPFQENNNGPLKTKHHPNGDIQIYYPDKIIYFYNKEKITQTRFKEGKEIIEFQTGQKEMYFPDGSHQIIFPDKSCISVYGDGTQNIVSVDGTSTRIKKDGTKVIEFPNGQKEIYQNDIIERIYPDGTVKLLYSDGMQETRYKNGHIRIKTKDGRIIMK